MLACGCTHPSRSATLAPREHAEIDSDWLGCSAWVNDRGGVICEVTASAAAAPASLTLLDDRVDRESQAEIDGRAATTSPTPPATHGRKGVKVDLGAWTDQSPVRTLRLRTAQHQWMLRIRPHPHHAWMDQAKALRERGEAVEAERLALLHADDPAPYPRALAWGFLARLELSQGQPQRAADWFGNSIAALSALGRYSEASDDALALAFMRVEREHRAVDARDLLVRMAQDLRRYPEGRARAPYYLALAESELGQVRTARPLVQRAREGAAALGMSALERNAYSLEGLIELRMGNMTTAQHAFQRAEASAVRPCDRAASVVNRAYATLARVEAKDEPRSSLASLQRELTSLTDATRAPCTDIHLRALAAANLAHWFILNEQPDAALGALLEAKTLDRNVNVSEALLWLDLESRARGMRGETVAAMDGFARERTIAIALRRHEDAYRSDLGSARLAIERARRHPGSAGQWYASAERALRRGEEALDAANADLPFLETRAPYFAARGEGLSLLLTLLVRDMRDDEAFRVARHSRARTLQNFARQATLTGAADTQAPWTRDLEHYQRARRVEEARAARDWELSQRELAEELRRRQDSRRELDALLEGVLRSWPAARALPLGTGTADSIPEAPTLLEVPATPPQLFLASHQRVERVTLDDRSWLLRSADPLRVLALGAGLRNVHDVPRSLVYALDLPGTSRTNTPFRAGLLIADPTGDLPEASREASAVAAAWHDAKVMTTRLEGRSARRELVMRHMQHADILHVAGHARVAQDGIFSAVPLGDGGELTVADILVSERVPRLVVLLGCGAGAQIGKFWSGVGLAEAFVLAGAELAIAPTADLEDKAARTYADVFYRELSEGDGPWMSRAIRAANHASHALAQAFPQAPEVRALTR